ncbi:MAG: response regulator [Bacteroidota bacterium]
MRKAPMQRSTRSALPDNRSVVQVLLIEDDASYADLVKILLSANPEPECEVFVASTLEDGMQALEERQDFDAVLLDLSLPDSEGLDTLLTVLNAFPTINVIVLTGSDDQEQGVLAVGAGAQDYLVKGNFEPSHLARVLRFSMERKQILMRLEEAQRIAKIGNWEFRPADNYFFASPQVYEMLGVNVVKTQGTYSDIEQSSSPLHFLLVHESYPLEDEITENLELTDPDGSKTFFQLNSRRTYRDDDMLSYVGTLQDTTLQRKTEELQRAQELAEETARVREQVIATVSHELRTPMNAIVGMSHLLADTAMNGEQQQYVSAVQEASQLLLGIINDILLTSSLQNDALQLKDAAFDLVLTSRRIVEMLRPKAVAKGLELHFQVDPCLQSRLVGDKKRVSQVLYNILGNAIKFTNEGKVELAILCGNEKGRDTLELRITDTGPGIPAEKQADIFLAFSRLKHTMSTDEGTGLGLSIAQELVRRMGGQIRLESELGKGATFTVVLPLRVAETTDAPAQQIPIPQETNDCPAERILLVEDHAMNQIVLEKTLEKRWPDLTVRIASTGAEARKWWQQEEFDLILMDIQLPDDDGFSLTQELRASKEGYNIQTPILAMTAQTQITADERYLKAGMDDYILKPFNPEDLFRKITQHTNNKHNST